MSVSEADIAFALELFDGLPAITTRKMMGGLCLYSEGTIFALLYSDGTLFIKGAGEFQQEIEELGGVRWTYTRDNGKVTSMPYWSIPDQFLDDPAEAQALARRALSHL
ncbi:DNA transformation protein [Litoreibacter ponti]|uniref:DNA transformation protein n=1 Tax=Litoreibacter ponti TaxID=1510457 RepID=A0A2T6BKD6_9RHOB|nr:TfoX/Sxy family protein [Litoreibacter ponti]PTX56518.1 DNA transformation protein [Litoreibacter ponti]